MLSHELQRLHLVHRRDDPDERDVPFAPPERQAALPASVDLRPHCGPVYNQLKLKSCSAHALASVLTYVGNKSGTPIELPSRLFIYYNERKLVGTQDSDSGSTLRNGIKAVAKQGACAETLWPYDPAMVVTPPPQKCYDAANVHAIGYARIEQQLDHVK